MSKQNYYIATLPILYLTQNQVNGSLIVPCGKITTNKLLISLYLICLISPMTFLPAPFEVYADTETSQRVKEPTTGCHRFVQFSLFDSQDVLVFRVSFNYFLANK